MTPCIIDADEDSSTIVDATDFTFTGKLQRSGLCVMSFSCMKMFGMKVTVSRCLLKPWCLQLKPSQNILDNLQR